MVPGFDEIIFENRNKEYGAYDLRKRYASATIFSLLGAVALSVIITLIIYTTTERVVTGNTGGDWMRLIKVEPIIQDLNQLKQPEPEKPAFLPDKKYYGTPEVVDDTSGSITTFLPNDILADSVQNGKVTGDDTSRYSNDPIIPVEKDPEVFVEEMPAFPGGDAELLKFLSSSIKYPAEALDNSVEGKVVVRFVVSADGTVKRPEILKGVDPLLDKEAMRVVSLLPKWKPGKQNGQPVAVWFFVPVTFQIRRN